MAEVPADRWPAALEALLLMADEPMRTATMAEALGIPEPAVTPILTELAAEYTRTGRGFELRRAGGGWRYYTRPEFADVLAEWVVSGRHARLSQAALETLAVVAYLQPVSRARVAAIRGVSVDGVMRTLVARGLITEAGADERTGATQFVTTDHFLTRLGLNSLTELPPLAPHLPDTADLADELGRLAESGPTEPDPTQTNPSQTPTERQPDE
ncbi:SMC-Scp complex subunit ScpB [Granulicoccus phenolivorans]|uniref:SMC-Scp complex subunit ScpB n=1 Tax=Granulicoccus phenolivorans TaxID=266854 RepID=UPI0004186B3B|nr:SMC-Scp complex subunit ScpB [Granulicoccus phenolivorans]